MLSWRVVASERDFTRRRQYGSAVCLCTAQYASRPSMQPVIEVARRTFSI